MSSIGGELSRLRPKTCGNDALVIRWEPLNGALRSNASGLFTPPLEKANC
jgi:hypothetical protein